MIGLICGQPNTAIKEYGLMVQVCFMHGLTACQSSFLTAGIWQFTFWKRQTDNHPYFMQEWTDMMKVSLNFTLRLSFSLFLFWLDNMNVSHHDWTTKKYKKRHWILGDGSGRLWDAEKRRLWQRAFRAVVAGQLVAPFSCEDWEHIGAALTENLPWLMLSHPPTYGRLVCPN